jgi:hypothetical protein
MWALLLLHLPELRHAEDQLLPVLQWQDCQTLGIARWVHDVCSLPSEREDAGLSRRMPFLIIA